MPAAPLVLIIEDNADTADSLAAFLRLGCGFQVATARDGLAGLRMAVADPPDAVVCDLGLPRRNGLLVAEELADTLPTRPLLIAVTGYADQVPEELARDAGFDHLLAKPADPAALGGLIRAHTGPGPALKV
jgi:DNA-binding response OmpR family regulator